MHINGNWPYYLLQIIINLSVYIVFIWHTFKSKMKYSALVNRFIVVIYGALSGLLIGLFFIRNAPYPQYHYLGITIWLILSALVGLLAFRSALPELLFLIFMIFSIQLSVMTLSAILEKLGWVPTVFADADVQFLFITIVVLLLFVPILWYLSIHLYKRVVSIGVDRVYWKYLFIIPLFSFSSYFFSFLNGATYSRRSLVLTLLTAVSYCAFNFMSYAVVLRMLIKTHESIEATESAALVNQQLLVQSEQYKRLSEAISQTERMRHDMRHHFAVVKGFVSSNDIAGANDYLDQCIGAELPENTAPICEKHSVDMILRHYLSLAQKDGITVRTAVQLPKDFAVPDTDLCVIFGNLVENALESCQRQKSGERFIEINAQIINGGMLALKISNSYDEEIHKSRNLFISRKHSGVGLGTDSAQNIVTKNGGTCKFKYENNVFTVSVLLMS